MNPTLDQLAYAALMVFVFSIPWSEELPNLGGVMAVRWLGLIALSMGVARAILAGRIRKLSVVHLAMIAFTMWSALSLLWTIDFDTTLTRAATYLQLLTAVWLIWEVANTESRIAGLMAAYVMGAGAASVGSITNFLMGRTAAQLSAAEDAHQLYSGTRYTIEGTNANDLGLMLALSVPMSVYLLTRVKNGALSLLIWIQVAACVFALLLTASRGGMAAMGTGLLMLPFAWRRLPSTQRAVSIIATACIAVWAIWMIPPEIWQRLGRATTELESGTLTHRLDLWEGGLETFRDHPWLGVGSGTYGLAIMRLVDIPYAAHNTFLSVFVELGTLGGLLLLGLVGILVYCALRMRYLEACLWLTLLLTWGVGVSALTWEYRKPTWFLFGLLAAHAYVRRKWFAPKRPIFHEKRIYDRRDSYRYRPHFGGVRTARP